MKKMINKTHIEGIVYENELSLNVAGPTAKNPGMEYVRGKLHVETAEGNTVTVEIYESAKTSKGAPNGKFDTAKALVNARTIVKDGKENATHVKIDSAIALNDWFKGEELISSFQNFGGFIHIVSTSNPSATFETDVVVVNTVPETKKNSEDGTMEETGRLIVNGYVFDYRGSILPVKFIVENQMGIKYFEDLEPNTFTKIWGNQVSSTIKTSRVEESAFGESKVIESEYSKRELVITGVIKEPYEMSEGILTLAEIQKALADRQVYLADKKKKNEEYKASKGASASVPGANNALNNINLTAGGQAMTGEFNF